LKYFAEVTKLAFSFENERAVKQENTQKASNKTEEKDTMLPTK
jgi:hypothetical protein